MDKNAEQNYELKNYKSPKRMLVRFFEKSRNKWKDKCKKAEYQIKLLRNKIRYMEKNKTVFKNRVKGPEAELQQMRDNEKRMADETEQLKKKL